MGVAALLLTTRPSIAQEPQLVRGEVKGADGKPVAGAEAASFWQADGGKSSAYAGVKTNAEGRFELPIQFYGRPSAIYVLSDDRKRGCIAVVKPDDKKPVPFDLKPLAKVHGRITSPELGRRPGWTNIYVMDSSGQTRFLACQSDKAEFALSLPPGEYKLWGYGSDVESVRRPLVVKAGETTVDLKDVELPATVIAKHTGKAPPAWTVTDARGLKKEVQPGDFKGKWVLIEFWGFW
jgi:hypothetical protein